jgi:hypothetical protein
MTVSECEPVAVSRRIALNSAYQCVDGWKVGYVPEAM